MRTICEFVVNGLLATSLIYASGVAAFSLSYWIVLASLLALCVFNRGLGYLEGKERKMLK